MASRTDSLEQEVKLNVGLGFEVPDLTGVVEGAITDRRPTVQLVVTYFDTPGLRLPQWPGRAPGIPDEARGLVRGIVRHATLGAVAELETIRQRLVLRDHGGSQDGQTRVATRRLRSDLKTFAAVVDPVWLSHTRADLKWIADSLGAVRDIDILAGHLETEMGHAPPPDTRSFAEIPLQLIRRHQAAHADLLEDMSSERYLTLLDRLQASSQSPPLVGAHSSTSKTHAGLGPDDPAGTVLPTLVRRPWRKLRKAVCSVGAHLTDHELHRIRVRAKRLRYAAEAAAPVVGKPAKRMAAGQLVAVERHRQTRLRRQWRRVWSSLNRKKLRRWLR